MIKFDYTDGPFRRNPKLVKYIIIHCSATSRGRDIGAAEIKNWHLRRGFRDIGYHFVVRLDGSIEPGRPLGHIGAHCLGKNDRSIGICYVGGLEKNGKTPADTRTEAQKEALERLIKELKALFPDAAVVGHRDFAAKACPCFNAAAEYAMLMLVVVLTTLCLTSCRVHKDKVSVKALTTDLTTELEGKRTAAEWLSDSAVIFIERPVFEYRTKDSATVRLTAENVRAMKKSVKNSDEEQDLQIVVSESHSEDVSVKEETDRRPWRALSWPIVLTAAAILFIIMRKLNRK